MIFFFLAPLILYWRGNKNYLSWSQVMRSFLKGRMPWHYYTGAIIIPVKGASEEDAAFLGHMILWDSHNHMILTWIRNTSISSISNLLGSMMRNQHGICWLKGTPLLTDP